VERRHGLNFVGDGVRDGDGYVGPAGRAIGAESRNTPSWVSEKSVALVITTL